MYRCEGKTSVYLLFLVLGIGAGLIGGAEFMRRLYSGSLPYVSNYTDAADTVYREPEPEKSFRSQETAVVQDDVNQSRKNAIVASTRLVAPCVVGIVVTQIQVVRNQYYSDDFFDFFFGPELMPRYRQVESIGSGFVIRKDGMILTNYHVVQNAAKLYVNFSDGRQVEGVVVGVDERSDLAVISVKGDNFKSVRFGNSDEAMIGEWAIAIGNPFLNFINDAHPTVTVGVVSALNRNFAPTEGVYYQGMIQTDAAINPGNSGGPLVNAQGEVIGINTFIYTGSNASKGSIGIGFAIPINRARKVAEELIKYGKRRRVWTGISVQNLNRSIALSLGYEGTDGVVIVSVQPGSPGEKAGLRVGDIIRRMGNRVIQSHADIDGFFLDYFVDDRVKMVIIRKGKTIETGLTLSEYTGK
ncbi:MAG TPA: trypsin-like peptidase domain-containing protein [Chitinispirillaceae bacterium]|jgi:serine protease Do|nr:trypsin-like peptidase domain-containing protein [Chitinispirillaceae bacterium]